MTLPVPFCTCTDTRCPNHPRNHEDGCTRCIRKNLLMREIPTCFFKLLEDCEVRTSYKFEDFAALVLSRTNSPS